MTGVRTLASAGLRWQISVCMVDGFVGEDNTKVNFLLNGEPEEVLEDWGDVISDEQL